MLTPQQPDCRRADPGFAEARAALWRAAKAEGCVPVVVSRCAPEEINGKPELVAAANVS